MNAEALYAQLREHEGVRLRPYTDTAGKLTIGVGHNLTDCGISLQVANYILQQDVDRHLAHLDRELPWWRQLDDVRQRALADMAFNLGIIGLLAFKRFLAAVEGYHWQQAVDELKRSAWWFQVGRRGPRLALMLLEGRDVNMGELP